MKFNAQGIIDLARQKAPEIVGEGPEKENTSDKVTVTSIDFAALSQKISSDRSIGKKEVDSSIKFFDKKIEKEASLND